MRYVATKPDLPIHSTFSTEDFADAQLVMSPDADLAGDLETAKSTTGMFLELRPRDGARSWPLSAVPNDKDRRRPRHTRLSI